MPKNEGKINFETLTKGAAVGAGVIGAAQIMNKIEKNNEMTYELPKTPGKKSPETNVKKLSGAIADNETGGVKGNRYTSTQKSGDSKLGDAIGKYRVVADEIKHYSKRFLGKEITPEQFKNSPKLQDDYIAGKIKWLMDNYGWGPEEILAAHRGGMSKPNEIQRIKKERSSYVTKGMNTYNQKT
jgi:hypothetical protein